jgi:valyl-tRNA synthetase
LKFYEKECQRSKQLLANSDFLKKAPSHLVQEEQKKLIYYQKQKKEIEEELNNL